MGKFRNTSTAVNAISAVAIAAGVTLAAGVTVGTVDRGLTVAQCAELRAVSAVMPLECGRHVDVHGNVTVDGLTYAVMPCDTGVIYHYGNRFTGC